MSAREIRYQINHHICSCGHSHPCLSYTLFINPDGHSDKELEVLKYSHSQHNYYILETHVDPGGARYSMTYVCANLDDIRKIVEGEALGHLALFYGEYFDLYVYEKGEMKQKIDLAPLISVTISPESKQENTDDFPYGTYKLVSDQNTDLITGEKAYSKTGLACNEDLLSKLQKSIDQVEMTATVDLSGIPVINNPIKKGEYADHVDKSNYGNVYVTKLRYGIESFDNENGGFHMATEQFIE